MLHLRLQHRAIDGRVRLKSSFNVYFKSQRYKVWFLQLFLEPQTFIIRLPQNIILNVLQKRLSSLWAVVLMRHCDCFSCFRAMRRAQQSRQRLHTADTTHQKQLHQIELQIQLCGSPPCSSDFYVTSTSIRSAVELNWTFTSMCSWTNSAGFPLWHTALGVIFRCDPNWNSLPDLFKKVTVCLRPNSRLLSWPWLHWVNVILSITSSDTTVLW